MKSCEEINKRKKYLEEKILETEEEKDKNIFRSQYKQLDSEFCKIGLALKKAVNSRIVHNSGVDPTIYEIMEYVSAENGIKGRRIYDQNKLLLEDSKYPKF